MRTAAALESRIRRLEARHAPPLVVRCLSFIAGELSHIVGPRQTWHRQPDESADALRRRAVDAAAEPGYPVIVLREVNQGAEALHWKG